MSPRRRYSYRRPNGRTLPRAPDYSPRSERGRAYLRKLDPEEASAALRRAKDGMNAYAAIDLRVCKQFEAWHAALYDLLVMID